MGKISDDSKNELIVSKFLTTLMKKNKGGTPSKGSSSRRLTTDSGSGKRSKFLPVPEGRGGGRSPSIGGSPNASQTRQKRSSGSVRSGSSGGSSGGGSDGSLTKRRKRRKDKKKDKKDTILSRIRDYIAEKDVFVSHNAVSPHLTCIRICYISILPFTIIFLWDLLAVTYFEIPHLSTIAFPGFVIIFQFITVLLAMYGYAVQFVTTGSSSPYITMVKFAMVGQFILFVARAVMEFMCEGFRYQETNYIPDPWSLFPKAKRKVT